MSLNEPTIHDSLGTCHNEAVILLKILQDDRPSVVDVAISGLIPDLGGVIVLILEPPLATRYWMTSANLLQLHDGEVGANIGLLPIAPEHLPLADAVTDDPTYNWVTAL